MDLANTMGIGVIVSMAVTNMTALSTAQRSLSNLFITAEGGTAKLTGLGKAMVGVAAAAASMKLGMMALNFTMDNIETYAEFEFQMAHLEGLLGRNRDEMQGFTDAAYDMAISTRYTAAESSAAMWEIASAGYEENEILEILPISAQAAAVGNMEMAEATDMLTSAMRSFRIPATDAEQTMDQILTAMRLSKLHMDEFSSGFGRFGSVAAAANQDLSETLAIFGTFRTRGLSATRSATMVKMMLTHLMALTEAEQEMMHGMGVEIVDPMTGKFRGLLDIVEDLDQALPQISEAAEYGLATEDEDVLYNNLTEAAEARMRALVDIWGMRAVASFYAITTAQQQIGGQMYEGVDAVRAVGQEIDSNTGATQEYYDSLLQTWQEQKRILKSTVDLIKVLLGGALAKAIQPWLSDLREWIGQLAEFLRSHPEIAKAIGYTVLIAGVLFMAVGVFALLALLIGGIAAAVGSVGAGIVFGIPALLFAVLAAIPAIAYLVYTHFEEIKTFLMPYFQVIKQVVIRLIERLKVIWEVLWPAIKALLPVLYLGLMAALNILSIIVGFLLIGLDTIFASVETIYWLLYGLFTWDWEKVSSEIAAIWEGVSADIDEIMEVFIEKAYEAFVKIGDNILRWIMGEQAYTHAAEMNRISQEVMDAASEGNLAGVGGGIGSAVDVGMWGPGGWDARLAELAVPPQASGNRSVPRSGLYYLEEEEGVTQRGETSKQNIFNFRDIIVQLMGSGNNEQDAREIADLVYAEIENRLARVQ
jgi:hypothetical protein